MKEKLYQYILKLNEENYIDNYYIMLDLLYMLYEGQDEEPILWLREELTRETSFWTGGLSTGLKIWNRNTIELFYDNWCKDDGANKAQSEEVFICS